MQFTLRGRATDIDTALRSAHFAEAFGSLNSTTMTPAAAATFTLFADDDPDGFLNDQHERVHRRVARGEAPNGEEVLYVEAFTT